jgi:hypothetical protein
VGVLSCVLILVQETFCKKFCEKKRLTPQRDRESDKTTNPSLVDTPERERHTHTHTHTHKRLLGGGFGSEEQELLFCVFVAVVNHGSSTNTKGSPGSVQ